MKGVLMMHNFVTYLLKMTIQDYFDYFAIYITCFLAFILPFIRIVYILYGKKLIKNWIGNLNVMLTLRTPNQVRVVKFIAITWIYKIVLTMQGYWNVEEYLFMVFGIILCLYLWLVAFQWERLMIAKFKISIIRLKISIIRLELILKGKNKISMCKNIWVELLKTGKNKISFGKKPKIK